MIRFTLKKLFCYVVMVLLFATSCTKTSSGSGSNNETDSTKPVEAMKYLQWVMNEIYYWNEIAPKPNINSYSEIEPFFDACLVPQDRWSWMDEGSRYVETETGIYTSYGCNLGQAVEYYNDYSIYVRYVHKDSPFDKAGVTRGWSITKINGVDVHKLIHDDKFYSEFNKSGNLFTFKDIEGNIHDIKIDKSVIHAKSVLLSRVFTNDDYSWITDPVGYINYLEFNRNMLGEIRTAVAEMKAGGVKHLILDLRYNPGGNMDATELFSDLIANSDCEGKVLVRVKHNKKYSEWDNEERSISKISRGDESLDLEDLYIITGEATASASEILINGLKPLMNVYQVGDTTYGKPNGMYVQQYPEKAAIPDYVFLPICFYSVNSEGNGNYDNGLNPDHYRPDYPCTDWDKDDLVIACLKRISNGTYPPYQHEPVDISAQSKSDYGESVLRTPEMGSGYGRFCIDGSFLGEL